MAHLSRIAPLVAALIALPATAQTADQLQNQAKQALDAKNTARAADLLNQGYALDPSNVSLVYDIASIHATVGSNDQALADLTRAIDAGFVDTHMLDADPAFAPLRSDARLIAVRARMQQKHDFDAKLYDSDALASPYRDNLSDDEKVAGLSKFWSEVKYNFIYVDTLKKLDWDRLYLETLPKVRATRSTAEYYQVLMALCARLQDGHTNVYPADVLWNTTMARPRLATHLVEGRVLVRTVFDPELVALGVAPGTEILAVDGEPVKDYATRALAPFASASTPQDLDRRIYTYTFLSGPIDVAPRVRFRTAAGKIVDATPHRVAPADYRKAAPATPPFEFKMLPGHVAYVALNSFGDSQAADKFLAAFEQIKDASALIIDVRNNGGGNSDEGYRVLATLAEQPFQTSRWETRDYRPSYRAWRRALPNYGEPASAWPADAGRAFRKPVAVLSSSASYSAAEDFLVAFDTMQRGLIVGEASGGSTGQPLKFSLPGGGEARVCTKADTYADGRRFVGTGIQPNVKAAPTVADLQHGKDTVLDAALAALAKAH